MILSLESLFFFCSCLTYLFFGSTNVLAGPVYNARNVRLLYVVCLYILEAMLPTDLRPLVHTAERRYLSQHVSLHQYYSDSFICFQDKFFSKFEEKKSNEG